MAAPRAAEMVDAIRTGNRRALARAITLIESTRADHRRQAEELIAALLSDSGRSIRIGISGSPGVGKSSFIETFGRHLTEAGKRIAVLAVDPSSKVSGGSILGDKTRMEQLARNEAAFIRPSPAGRSLGGVARRTRETMLVCEAARYDVIIVETVGVGQSETSVAEMTDIFVLLLAPGGGDELQGMKKGIVELADLILVNKADGELIQAANHAAADYRSAVRMIRPTSPHWQVPVLTCSSVTGAGVTEVWDTIESYRRTKAATGEIAARRANQARAWMWSEIEENLVATFREHPDVAARVRALERDVAAGRTAPGAAARQLLEAFLGAGPRQAP